MAESLDTPLGAELLALSLRVLGPGPAAREAAFAGIGQAPAGRLAAIAATAGACRRRENGGVVVDAGRPDTLAAAVSAELAVANAALPGRQREALALREALRLSYVQIAQVMGLDVSAIPALLARARLRLRSELRGPYRGDNAACDAREHALRVLACRQDSEPLGESDDAWVLEHMADCPGCERAHAQMLEASVRYRAWALA